MHKIQHHEVMGFSSYVKCRKTIRQHMIAERKQRSITITDNIRLIFENKSTVQYQIQEVLYASRSSAEEDIQEQIDTYQHLLPSGQNLKATLMLEYEEASDAENNLNRFSGIEGTVYIQIGNQPRIWPHCNDDIDGQDIISPVHFLRYELAPTSIDALRRGATLQIGIAHYAIPLEGIEITGESKASLVADLI